MITSASLLIPGFDKYAPIDVAHDKDHLNRDNRFNLALAERFLKNWVSFYLPWLQERNKWRERLTNLEPGQLVMITDPGDFSTKNTCRMGRISEVFPDMTRGKPFVKRAKVNISVFDQSTDTYKVDTRYRNISSIASIDWCLL